MEWSSIGHRNQKDYLNRLLTAGSLPHGLIFIGPDGLGKKIVAEDIIEKLAGSARSLDVMRLVPVIDDDGTPHDIPIEDIRSLKSWVSRRPTGDHRCILIDDADRLGTEAANALLKILEEPPAYAHLFLITSRPHTVLPTIMSRCEHVHFRNLGDDDMSAILAGTKIGAGERRLVLALADGCPGVALRLIAQDKLAVAKRSIDDFVKILPAGIAAKLSYAKKILDDGNVTEQVRWWLAYARHELQTKQDLASAAHGLTELYDTVSQPQFNARLALEKFLLSC